MAQHAKPENGQASSGSHSGEIWQKRDHGGATLGPAAVSEPMTHHEAAGKSKLC